MRSADGKETLLYKCLKIPLKILLKMGLVSVNHQLKSDWWNMWLCMYHSISSTCLNVVQYRNSRELNRLLGGVCVFSVRFLYCHRAWDKVGVGFKFRRGFSSKTSGPPACVYLLKVVFRAPRSKRMTVLCRPLVPLLRSRSSSTIKARVLLCFSWVHVGEFY